MNDEFDKVMKDYFANKTAPSSSTIEKIHSKLIIACQKRIAKQLWLTTLGIIIFAVVIFLVVCAFTTSLVITYFVLANLLFSIIGSITITIISKKEQIGGNNNVILD